MNTSIIKSQTFRYIIVPVLGSLLITLISRPHYISASRYASFFMSSLYTFSLWSIISYGIKNGIIRFMNHHMSWESQPGLKSLITVISIGIYIAMVTLSANYAMTEWYLGKDFWSSFSPAGELNRSALISLTLTIAFAVSIYAGIYMIHYTKHQTRKVG